MQFRGLSYHEKCLLLGRANRVANADLAELPPEQLEIYTNYFEAALKLLNETEAAAGFEYLEHKLKTALRRALNSLEREIRFRKKGLGLA